MPSLGQIIILLAVMAMYGLLQYERTESTKLNAQVKADYQTVLSAALAYRWQFCAVMPSSMTGSQLANAGMDLSGVENPSIWSVEFLPQLSITYASTEPQKRGALLSLGGIIRGNTVTVVSSHNRIQKHRGRHAFVGAQQQDQCI